MPGQSGDPVGPDQQRAQPARPGVRHGGGVHDPMAALPLVHPAGGRHDCRGRLAWVGLDGCEALALFATG